MMLTELSASGWARTALSRGEEAVRAAIRAIEAYERAYDQPKNRRLRLEARSATCHFLKALHAVLHDDPRFFIDQGLLDRHRFERWEEKNREHLALIAHWKDKVCQPIADR